VKQILSSLGLLCFVTITSLLLAMSQESTAMQNDTNIFWSGHSLTDPPIPEMLAETEEAKAA